jgi:hypothetical protein
MTNFVIVKIKNIIYSGDNIGDDFKIETTINGHSQTLNLQLKHRQTRLLNTIVFQSLIDQIINLPIQIKVTEKDIALNDIGSTTDSLQISTVQENQVTISIDERGRIKKKKTAILTIVFKIISQNAIQYVPNISPDGWLKVKLLEKNLSISLPQGLKVQIQKIENNRQYFEILEGKFKGNTASVALTKENDSYFTDQIQHLPAPHLIFMQKERKLIIPDLGEFQIDMHELNEIPLGYYDLEIPDEAKPMDTTYIAYTSYSKTWFRIGHSGDRFLHMGETSAGCITVIEKKMGYDLSVPHFMPKR